MLDTEIVIALSAGIVLTVCELPLFCAWIHGSSVTLLPGDVGIEFVVTALNTSGYHRIGTLPPLGELELPNSKLENISVP